ncbi:hypothetical protein GWD52_11615 [Enterobacteriaceae bacterium 4M9]|jgi:hypothetical protein|uniref:Uncharacterized protein n=2 Tax=Tenebrionibacter/Tenebrionicola group TaxID=2969848 RepID=A0A8K0XZ71_9ENTR|nr:MULTISPECIES: hypothetical protein [Tenebrionibacter/Tenebrionicola group]MBK4717152.1 hypothetical protein [Tenebrionibacter intestinalis]MBV5097586.1 hypothetical protein [Tenebrionicola larvae]NDJ57629.1 hypothetical protein [Enterobacteriaceae bacterium 4M9]
MILKKGIVINGEYAGWEIQIVDDTQGDTGGFYLILRSEEAQVFDYWFEKKEFLNNQLTDFTVNWNS